MYILVLEVITLQQKDLARNEAMEEMIQKKKFILLHILIFYSADSLIYL